MATPTLNLSPQAQDIYNKASADPQFGPDVAMAAAQEYDRQQSIPDSPSLKSSGNILTSKDSFLNLPTLGSVGGAMGGAALGTAILPGVGTVLGGIAGGLLGGGSGEAARESLNGENLDTKEIVKQGLIGGASEAGGQVLGAGLKAGGRIAGNLLGKEADTLAIKGLGTTDSQLAKFAEKHGEDIKDVMIRNNLAGSGADEIASRVGQLDSEYGNLIRNSGLQVDQTTLRKNMVDRVMPLLESTDPQDHSIAETILKNFDNIDETLMRDPSLEKLNTLKSGYDSKVNYGKIVENPEQFGPKKVIADALRQTVYDTVDNAGMGTSVGTLKETGQELKKLKDLLDIAERGSYKGVSRAPIGLTNLLASSVFGSVSGPAGNVVGAFLPGVINNPKSLAILSKLSSSLGNVAAKTGEIAGGAATSLPGRAVEQVTARNMNPQPVSSPSLPSLPKSNEPSLNLNQPAPTNAGMTRQDYMSRVQQDLATTGGAFIPQLTAMFNAQNPDVTQGLSVASSALNTLTDLYDQAGGAKGGLIGGIENALGEHSLGYLDQNVKSYNDQAQAIGQDIVNAVYGTGGTAEERDRILHNIPQITDSAQNAKVKIQTLKRLIEGRLQANMNPTAGGVSLNLNQ